jgi:hypothetical protein
MRHKYNKFIKHNAIIAIVLVIPIFVFIYQFHGPLSNNVNDWASFSTFLGLSLSLISVIYIYLTYRSQIGMSSVLQFESTFFQWYALHRELKKDLEEHINTIATQCILPWIKNKDEFYIKELPYSPIINSEMRLIVPYYRSVYSLLKYIEVNELLDTYEKKKKYYDIIQGQMTDNEQWVILYLLMCDKNIFDTRVLKSKSYKDLLDEAHFFKNLYYSSSESNFKQLSLFLNEIFPKTRNSFHFFKQNELD